MDLFEYTDYKAYVRDRIQNMPKKGRGEFRKISQVLGVSSTIVSHIFKGDRHLTTDHGLLLSNHLGLNDLETRYFLLLLNMERAASHQLKTYYQKEILALQEQSKSIKNNFVTKLDTLSEEFEALYFSDWKFGAFHLLTAIPGHNTIDAIADYFQFPRDLVQQVVSKLIQNGLLVDDAGKLTIGPFNAYLDPNKSQVINGYRRNWRLKSLEKINHPKESDVFFSSVHAIDSNAQEKVRTLLTECLGEINRLCQEAKAEELHCINVDWFQLK